MKIKPLPDSSGGALDDLVAECAALIEERSLLILPTETRYGLVARADLDETVRAVFDLKQRPYDSPTALFVSWPSVESLAEVTESARKLADRFLPGPLTLVLKATRDLGPSLSMHGKVGVRVSSHPLIQALMERVSLSLTATSANLNGQPELETLAEMPRAFADTVALAVDAGRLNSPTSTVVDCTTDEVKILREGALSRTEIEKVWKVSS